MKIVRVVNKEALSALFSFRHEVYVDQLGWLPQHPSGLLCDAHDDCAFNYAAIDESGLIIGSVRVVPDGPLGLPLERCCPLDSLRAECVLAEICRLAVAPDQRGSRLGGLLMKAAYQRCIAIGATHIALVTYVGRDAAGPLYEKMGFEHIEGPYPDPEYCFELPVVSLSLDIERAQAEWPAERPGLYRFFTSDAPDIDHGQ